MMRTSKVGTGAKHKVYRQHGYGKTPAATARESGTSTSDDNVHLIRIDERRTPKEDAACALDDIAGNFDGMFILPGG